MLEKTKGIFLHSVKYSETSIVATIYTEAFGRQSFLINGVRGKNAKIRASILQPLYLLELEMYSKPGRGLQRLKEARIISPFVSIPYDIRKSTQVLFLAEVLYKCLHEEENNPELFDFLFHAVAGLDQMESGISNFHLWILFRLTKFLGIFPSLQNAGVKPFFDLKTADFVAKDPDHFQYMDKQQTSLFIRLYNTELDQLRQLEYSKGDREVLLEKVLEFYKIHFDFFGEIKSLSVLKEILKR